MNARSVRNKVPDIADFILETKSDICAVTESWLSNPDKDQIEKANATPEGFVLISQSRLSKRGGGVVLSVWYINLCHVAKRPFSKSLRDI